MNKSGYRATRTLSHQRSTGHCEHWGPIGRQIAFPCATNTSLTMGQRFFGMRSTNARSVSSGDFVRTHPRRFEIR